MILNEYKYATKFASESDAKEYYEEHGLKITKDHITGSYFVVDDYKEIKTDTPSSSSSLENKTKSEFSINDKKFKDILKSERIQVGEHNIIRTMKPKDVLKKIQKIEKKYGKKVNYTIVIQGGDNFIQLL